MSKKSLKNNLLAIAVCGALSVAQPDVAHSDSLISGFYMQMEGRYAINDSDNGPHAVNIFTGSLLKTDRINFDEDITGRFSMGVNIGRHLDVGIHYSGLNIHGTGPRYVCAPLTPCVGPLGGNGIGAPSYTPFVGDNFETVYSDTSYHIVDLEVGYSLQLGQVSLRPFLGVRYADFDINTQNTGSISTAPVSVGHIDFARHVNTTGFGPKLGVDGHVPIGTDTGFGIGGSIGGSILFGDRDIVDSMLLGNGVVPSPLSGSVQISDGVDTFYNAEADLGMTYSVAMGNASSMMMTVGYRIEAFFDVNSTRSSFAAGGANFYPAGTLHGDKTANQVFHGPFLRARLNF